MFLRSLEMRNPQSDNSLRAPKERHRQQQRNGIFSALLPNPSQAHNSPHGKNSCKRCGSDDLFVKQQSVHLGLFCRQCGLWQKWITKSEARRRKAAASRTAVFDVAPTAPAVTQLPLSKPVSPSFESHTDCSARFEKIERELSVVLKAILACGVLQSKGGAPIVDVDDERVSRLVETLAREEEGR